MNKEEFIKKLRKRLSVLEDKEIEDIVSEYEGYIDEKVGVGLSEQEAIKDLGDFDEIVSDLLAAYKVKSPKNEDNDFNRFVNYLGDGFDKIMNSLNNKSGQDIVRILIEIILILFLICILKIPFAMIRDLGTNIFSELMNPVGSIFRSIWIFVIELCYIIVAVILFIKMLEKRYFKGISENIVEEAETEIKEANTKKENKKETKNEPKEELEIKRQPEKNNSGIINGITSICMTFIKFVVVIILIGVIFYLIGMSIALGTMIYLIISGVKYFGILILLIGLFMGGTLILELGVNFICNKRFKAHIFLSKLITIIVLTGAGLTISGIEIANTEIIYDGRNQTTKTITKEINMKNDLVLYNYDKVVIDDSLTNTIKIEYNYPDMKNYADIAIDLEPCINGYCLHTDITYAKWNKEFINTLIENLKDKKIYTYDYRIEKVIYLSSANYEAMKNNSKQYDYSDYDRPDSIFTKTYYINNKTEDSSGYYYYLTIYPNDYQERMTSVKVSKSIGDTIESGNTYTFTFSCEDNILNDDDIREVFAKCEILKVEPSNIPIN